MSTEPDKQMSELESNLAGLSPAPPRLDRDGLMYAAGRAAGARLWKRSTAGLGVTVLALGAFVSLRPIRERERIITVMAPAPSDSKADLESPSSAGPIHEPLVQNEGYEGPKGTPQLEMRWRMLRWGPESVPVTVGGSAQPVRSLEQDLDLPLGSLKGADVQRKVASSPW